MNTSKYFMCIRTVLYKLARSNGGPIRLDATHAEPAGYLANCQRPEGRIYLISSRNYYVFNLAWLSRLRPQIR